MRYFFHISYNGSQFRGWQRQPDAQSVQACIEDQLSLLLKKDCHIMGCGRTDALVHANQFYFHLDLADMQKKYFVDTLNKMLPSSICIHEIIEVESHNHAQHSALSRTYDYFFHTKRNPYISSLSTYYQIDDLNYELIEKALDVIVKTTDFYSCCLTPLKHGNTECKFQHAQFFQNQSTGLYRFQFKADHFLRGMIRILVGKLLLIGTGEIALHEFEEMIQLKQQPKFLNQAYAQGLYLSGIEYAFLNQPPISDPFQTNSSKDEWKLLSKK